MTNRLIDAHTPSLGGSTAQLGLNATLVNSGWPAYVAANVTPNVDWGVSRVLLHMPWGRPQPSGDYPIDMWQHCIDKGLTNVTSPTGFKEAFKPLVNNGVEVIFYLGMLQLSTHWTRNFSQEGYGDWIRDMLTFNPPRVKLSGYPDFLKNWLRNIVAAMYLPLSIGASIAIDASSDLVETDAEWAVLESLHRGGVKVYTETASNLPHFRDKKQLIIESFYEAQIEASWMPTARNQYDEFCRWPATPGSPPAFDGWSGTGVKAAVDYVQADGHTAVVACEWLRTGGYSRSEFQ